MSTKVGPRGRVSAWDLDVSQLSTLAGDNVDVVQVDIRREQPPTATFDLIHARMVLGHLEQRDEILGALLRALAPGGWIVIAEPRNYPAPAGTTQATVSAKLTRALQGNGQDVDWIWGVPARFSREGLGTVGISCDTPVVRGGSLGADFAQITAVQLTERGLLPDVSREDLEEWRRETQDPDQWRPLTSLISAWGQRSP